MKTIIAGSRDFNDYNLLASTCKQQLITEVVSGTARGADLLGERYAGKHAIPVKKYPARWDLFGKSAGYRRNEEMAKYADACVIFWDGESKGTKHMIDLAKKYSLKLTVVLFKKESV